MQPRLTRTRSDRMIAGVCGGLGHYFGVDPVIVRLIFVVLAITTGITPILYPVLWLIMPESNTPAIPSMNLPPDARFDPLTGQPLTPQVAPRTGQTVSLEPPDQPQVAPQGGPPPHSRNRTLGFLLLGVGALFLLNTLGDALGRILGVDASGWVFPVLLVGLGFYLLRKNTV